MRRIVLPLLALAVLLPSTALARAQFLCNVDRIVRDHCCCPGKKAKPPIDAPIVKAECCTIEQHAAQPAPVATAAPELSVDVPVATLVATTIVIPPTRELATIIVARAQAPPPERSLFSLRCAFLV